MAIEDGAVRRLIGPIVSGMGGVALQYASTASEALALAQALRPHLVMGEVEFAGPGGESFSLVKAIRSEPALSRLAILAVGRNDDLPHRYAAFADGADDYVSWPFDALELQFRIKALLRRACWNETPEALEVGDLRLDEGRFVAVRGGREIALTPSEFALLRYLMRQAGRRVSVEELLTEALSYPRKTGDPQVIYTHVKNLRAKLVRDAQSDPIQSSRHGYLLANSDGDR